MSKWAQAAVFILHEDLSLWQDVQKEIHRAVRGKFCTVLVGDKFRYQAGFPSNFLSLEEKRKYSIQKSK